MADGGLPYQVDEDRREQHGPRAHALGTALVGHHRDTENQRGGKAGHDGCWIGHLPGQPPTPRLSITSPRTSHSRGLRGPGLALPAVARRTVNAFYKHSRIKRVRHSAPKQNTHMRACPAMRSLAAV